MFVFSAIINLLMKNKWNSKYSITAYLIRTKSRQKFYDNHNKESAVDKSEYIEDVKTFVRDFLKHLDNCKNDNEYEYLHIYSRKDIPGLDFYGVELFVNYGRSGEDFKTIESDGKEHSFGKETKIVKYYRIFFFIKNDGNCFMVIFRNGVNSCKTAIYNEMKRYLEDTNVILMLPYVSNNVYLEALYDDMQFISLNYATNVKCLSSDNADDNYSLTKKYSFTSIDLSIGNRVQGFLDVLAGLFKGHHHENKKLLCDLLQLQLNGSDDYIVDEDSVSVLAQINGVKRTIPIKDVLSFYDVDITTKLELDSEGIPTEQSIIDEVVEYVSGIEVEGMLDE